MAPTKEHDRPAPEDGRHLQRGALATVFATLRRHRRPLTAVTARSVGLYWTAALLLTVAVFACAWPVFTQMRNSANRYHHLEDPYLHDGTVLGWVFLGVLPLYLLLLGAGWATLQNACSRAVDAELPHPQGEPADRARTRAVFTAYLLRGLMVGALPVLALIASETLTDYDPDSFRPLKPDSPAFGLVRTVLPTAAVGIALLLRLALALAPLAAAHGLGARASLRRSWSLIRTRTGWLRVLALAVPLAALTAAVLRLTVQLALPLRPFVRALVQDATGNYFAGYYAGILAPVFTGLLITAFTLPLTCTSFALLYRRTDRERPVTR